MLVPAGKHPPYGSVLLEATSPVSGAVCCAISQEGHGGSGSSYGPRRWGLHSEAGCLGLRSPWGEKETPWGVSFPAWMAGVAFLLDPWAFGCLFAPAQEPRCHHHCVVCVRGSHTQGNSPSLTEPMMKQHPARLYFSFFSHNFARPRFPRQALAAGQAQAKSSHRSHLGFLDFFLGLSAQQLHLICCQAGMGLLPVRPCLFYTGRPSITPA